MNSAPLSFGPLPVVFQNRLWLFVRGKNGLPYYTFSLDGLSWEPWRNVSLVHFSSGPTPVVFQDKLWLFARGDDGRIFSLTSADGTAWPQGAWSNVAPDSTGGRFPLEAAPAVAVFQGQLILTVVGDDGQVYYKTSVDGVSWVPAVGQPWLSVGPTKVNSSPVLVEFKGEILLFARGMSDVICFKSVLATGSLLASFGLALEE